MFWPTTFRLVLIIDSAVFLLKLSIPIYMFVFGIKEKIAFDQLEESDGSHLTRMLFALLFLGASAEFILLLLRFYTNWSQNRNEMFENNSADNGKKYFWSTICWFIVSIIHIVIDGVLIAFDWTEGRWLHVVVICFITWELFIFCFMVTFKALFCTVFVAKKALETENSENGTPAAQRKVVEA